MTETESCFVFDPGRHNASFASPQVRLAGSTEIESSLQCLFGGAESQTAIEARLSAFEAAWLPIECRLNEHINGVNSSTFKKLASFIATYPAPSPRIPAAYLLARPGTGLPASLLNSVKTSLADEDHAIVLVELLPQHGSNLKSLCKHINQQALKQGGLHENGSNSEQPGNGLKHLSYDFEALHSHVRTHRIKHVLLSFPESEALSGSLVSDLIDLLSSWRDRIPIFLLFGISTSLQLFQDRLTKHAIDHILGQHFDIHSVSAESMFAESQRTVPSEAGEPGHGQIWIGPVLTGLMMRQQSESLQSTSWLIQAIKYAYMSHFFANPLSVFLSSDFQRSDIQPEHVRAIKMLPSFKQFCEECLNKDKHDAAAALLDDDDHENSKDFIESSVRNLKFVLKSTVSMVDFVHALQPELVNNTLSWTDIYVQALAGTFSDSVFFANLMGQLTRMPFKTFQKVFKVIEKYQEALNEAMSMTFSIRSLRQEVESFLAEAEKLDTNLQDLQSGHVLQQSRMQTTVVRERVSLQQQSVSLTNAEEGYTALIDRIYDTLDSCFKAVFHAPLQLPCYELVVYDLASPFRDVFDPRPRFSVERALHKPHDYLGHECCGEGDDALLHYQPAITLVYGLLAECGPLLNTADLWNAYRTIVRPQENGHDEQTEKGAASQELMEARALFTRALAELKYLGLIKHSRKKQDHVAKLTWMGL